MCCISPFNFNFNFLFFILIFYFFVIDCVSIKHQVLLDSIFKSLHPNYCVFLFSVASLPAPALYIHRCLTYLILRDIVRVMGMYIFSYLCFGFCRYIKEGSTVSVMGVVQRNENVLMIVPPPEPLTTGCQWGRCILPASLEGIVLRCEDASKVDVIPV